ncbi:MAG: hypothetical protein WCV84_04155 [Patescibacteria group bacterium]
MELKRDEQFEAFLQGHSPSETVRRLARASYYGMDAFEVLFPEDAAAPPEMANKGPAGPTGPTHFARLRYSNESSSQAVAIVLQFAKTPGADPELRRQYLTCSLALKKGV